MTRRVTLIPAKLIGSERSVQCSNCFIRFVRHNACTDPCDFDLGPCACGAWHNHDHLCPVCKRGPA